MKTNSSISKFLVLVILASTCAPAFARRPWFRPRVVVPLRPVIVAPVRGGGAVVRPAEVQRALARRGYYHGAIDGAIGPGSRGAIRAFQADHGMAATGEINAPLLRALGL